MLDPIRIRAWLNSLGNFTLDKVLPAVVILAVGSVCIRLVLKVVKATLKKTKLEKTAHSLIRAVCKVVLFLLLGLIVAAKLGIDVTGVVALASVLSLAVSLAVRTRWPM
jgi:small conductance mechanosensitive channel